jgi:sulfate adenylyltransferase large subunit
LSGNVLRFTTAGNVDDGKSTLIGRLLVETQGAFEDQIEGAKRENERRGGKGIDFSLLTDGLKAEREQGITIDVAYRYFATPKRKFIIADAPGHEQYTRNLVTSASNSDLAVILIDARNGIMTQSRRHTFIAHLLGIRHFIVAINKMDLVDFKRERFEEIKRDIEEFIQRIGGAEVHCIPISALQGDHVTEPSEKMSWYTGPKLLELLESIEGRRCSAPTAVSICRSVGQSSAGIAGVSGFPRIHGTRCFRFGESRGSRSRSAFRRAINGHWNRDARRSTSRSFARQSVTITPRR